MNRRTVLPLGIALIFVAMVTAWAALVLSDTPLRMLVIVAAAAAAYMSLNIGANDVANNMGPTVGAKALSMGAALAIAAVFEVAGAIMAGGNVVDTVANQLLAPDIVLTASTLTAVMISALLAAAAWINLSTFLGTPVSTTHAIVGGVAGAAVATAGVAAVDWWTILTIATAWTLSPLLGGILAAGLHTLTRTLITRRRDKIAAARLWVPIFCALMAGVFAAFIGTLARDAHLSWPLTAMSLAIAAVTWITVRPLVLRRSRTLENRKRQVARLFRLPLIVAAALLSFAHGANDVANALGPLAAILSVSTQPSVANLDLPLWASLTGALGLAVGLWLFGPKVIHTIGEQITKLNEIRAFCVALAAATTVLLASALGLPISSTHVAVGAVFGVGFLREYLAIRNMHGAAVPSDTRQLDEAMLNATPRQALARERRDNRRFLVRRLKVVRIGAAWLVTLPAAACLAAVFYLAVDRLIA